MFCTMKIVCDILYTKVSEGKSLVFKRVQMGRTEKFIYLGGIIMEQKNEIVLFETEDKSVVLPVAVENETVWLTLDQMGELFERDKSTISRHIKNIFTEGELSRNSVVANFATTASDGKVYQVDYYNLDVIISVGYRVKSIRGTQFRIWANSVLKQYIVKGYAVNNNRMHWLANLLYFVTKNHSFFDGNKRIAATMFLYFLDKNDALFVEGQKRLTTIH